MKKIFQIVLVIILAFVLVACKKSNGDGGNTSKELKITVVTPKNAARVQVEHTLQCTYKVTPSDAKIDSVQWEISNAELGTISQTGLFTAGSNPGLVKISLTATSGDKTVTGSKSIQITLEEVLEYPDLDGYTISIAQATSALGETDPFKPIETRSKYGYYAGADREARQEAWNSVEEDFNCHIEVIEYPSDAGWGPSRWSYIIDRARRDTPDYDIYTIPDAQVPNLSSANALVDLTDWYNKYGNDFMTSISKTAGTYKGKVYTINWNELNIYNILGYNVGLWEEINKYDSSIKEPAQMFLDGQWNYTNFIQYCKDCKDALDSLHPGENYCVLSGAPTYYFVGMVDRNGEGVADVAKRQVHILNKDATDAVNALKEIHEYGAFDSEFRVDEGVTSWNNGKALFNTGDLWFIGAVQGRWNTDAWGEGEATRYGYVPFAAPDGMEDPETTYTGITSEACWVMAAGREKNYGPYGDECTTENIYYAIVTYWLRAKQIYRSGDSYDPEMAFTNTAAAKFGSQASIEAFVKVSMNLETDAFYDPMTSNSNTVCATWGGDFDNAVKAYIKGTGAKTWAEQVGTMEEQLNESIQKAFG